MWLPLTVWLLKVYIYKPLHTLLLCGRKTKIKIGRFGDSEQLALCEELRITLRSFGILFNITDVRQPPALLFQPVTQMV